MARHGFNHRRSNKLTTPKAMTLAAQMAIIHASLFHRETAGLDPDLSEPTSVTKAGPQCLYGVQCLGRRLGRDLIWRKPA